jgi:hypothetical protein
MNYKIPDKSLLTFISNKDLYMIVDKVLTVTREATNNATKNLYNNTVDPFSAIFDALRQGITLSQWIKQEESRQTQKTMQNALGNFHQEILGCIPGWKDMKVGQVFDLLNNDKKIIAEVKNKYNTTKGNHKIAIYDDLESQLNKYNGYVAYYVEIIPQNKKKYNKPFTPSDNKTKTRREAKETIRQIDGQSFYKLATGEENALKMLYDTLPKVIGDILGVTHEQFVKENFFQELFQKAY